MAEQWRPDADAFSLDFSEQIAASIREMTTWINEQVEAGATNALIDALRSKGWKVIPPETKTSAHIEAGARAIRTRVAYGIDWDDGAAWMDALRAALDAAQQEKP